MEQEEQTERGFDFACFVEQQMRLCSHDQIRGCDEMMLDAFLKGHLDPATVLWQPHSHSIRTIKSSGGGRRKAGREDWDEAARRRRQVLEVGWRHLDIGDGNGLMLLCCPEHVKRKKPNQKVLPMEEVVVVLAESGGGGGDSQKLGIGDPHPSHWGSVMLTHPIGEWVSHPSH